MPHAIPQTHSAFYPHRSDSCESFLTKRTFKSWWLHAPSFYLLNYFLEMFWLTPNIDHVTILERLDHSSCSLKTAHSSTIITKFERHSDINLRSKMLKVNRVYFKCNLRLFTSYLVETYAQHYTVQKDTSTPREVYHLKYRDAVSPLVFQMKTVKLWL